MNGGLFALVMKALAHVGLIRLAKRTAARIVKFFTHEEEDPRDHKPPKPPSNNVGD